ncbi:tyrosine-type recombinase/integrase [Pseudoclavibacter sp. VKM Ac-2867]|uniref:tyrosine-type recombinase/integrase n=1 Tax=Pseudoclavibacter sp. VKM Ac-2867 TaxID=2783829 RepID=UPI00188AFBCB|nr:site-specific integrase [Pseudoclavibacter sp. VKM Ac-2867]MBF4459371.1 site-specific integrase [Pseudoclavibacter sp. VKM Ac-2867]
MITTLGNGKHRVRIYTGGVEVASKVFEPNQQSQAREWEVTQKIALREQTFIKPVKGRTKFATVAVAFLEAKDGVMNPQSLDAIRFATETYFPERLAKLPIGRITSPMIAQWYDELLAAGYQRSSVVRWRTAVKSVFTWAISQELVGADPISKTSVATAVATSPEPIRAMTYEQSASVVAGAAKRHGPYAEILEFFLETGLRWGELADLRVSRYEAIPRPYITVSSSASDGYEPKSTKSGRVRRVPLSPRARDIIERHISGKTSDALIFTSRVGGRLNGTNFKRFLDWKTLGIGFRIHDLRHTAATRWLSAGIDVATVSSWLGHSSATVTMNIYSHYLGGASDQIALERLAAHRASVERVHAEAVEPVEMRARVQLSAAALELLSKG